MSGLDRPVRLCDYSRIGNQELGLCLKMQEKIQRGQCHMVDLLELHPCETPRAPQDVCLVEQVGGSWQTRNYVGLFQLGEERVVITSRFDQPGKPFFLYYLLSACWDAALLSQEDLGGTYARDIFDLLLVTKLAVQLQKAWKKGTLRQYRTLKHNDSRVRGPIDVPRHIRENLGQDNGRIAYRTRVYSLDNPYNVLFLQAVDVAGRKYPALLNRLFRRLPEFQAALRTLRQEVQGWAGARRETVLRHTVKKIVNPVYRDYEPARTAARAILGQLGADPEGKSRHGSAVTGVFLDMDTAWERFLEKELFSGAQVATQKRESILGGHMNVKPDFWWREKGVVLDAKNRSDWGKTMDKTETLWSEYVKNKDDKIDVRDDVYQVLTYMLALGCQEGGVVFPQRDYGPQEPRHTPVYLPLTEGNPSLVDQMEAEIGRQFWRVPVYIPQAEDYPSFAKQMDAEIERLRGENPVRSLLE